MLQPVRARSVVVAAILLAPRYAVAHDGGPVSPARLLDAWSFDAAVIAGIALLAATFVVGARARTHRAPRARSTPHTGLFMAGAATLFVALVSPVAALGETLFAGHMVQHVLLTMVATPLLVAADLGTAILWALPRMARAQAGRLLRLLRPAWTAITRPLVAWGLHLGVLALWHWPPAYEAAVRSHFLHAIEHVSFVATAIPFWWNLLAPRRRQRLRLGGALLYLFSASLVSALLGALITVARSPWYLVHARGAWLWGLTPLEDQQLAGLIMWVPAGFIYLALLVAIALPALRRRAIATTP